MSDTPITPDVRVLPVPQWIYDGIFTVQRGEGHPIRWGNRTMETMDNIRRSLEPQMAERLERQGLNLIVLHAVMGNGIKGDLPNILANKPVARALKDKGIRRVAYVQAFGFFVRELLYLEKPEAANWVSRRPNGEPPYWYDVWFWPIPCLNNPEFIAYVKDVFRLVMRELDLDGLFLDCYGYFNYSCYCEHCQRLFREYLYKRYPDDESRYARFEMTDFTYILPPPFDRLSGAYYDNNGILDANKMLDPVTQEWIRFRCERVGEVTLEFNQCIKECNPDGLMYINYMYGGAPGMNNSLFHGLWPEFVYPHADLVLAEVAGAASINEGGVAQGRALMMKTAKHFGIPASTCSFQHDLKNFKRIWLAEGMAFNVSPVDLLGDIVRDDPPQWIRDYQKFYHTNRDLLGHAATVADCAVLHNFESMSFACSIPQESILICEQSLFQGGVTFDIIFNRDLEDLEKYRCLFLANVFCMSRDLIERVASYIRNGGLVIATEDTSTFNDQFIPWRGTWPGKMLKIPLLGELLGIEWPKEGTLKQAIGKGRIAILPKIARPWATGDAANQPAAVKAPVDLAYHSYGPAMPGIMRIPALTLQHQDILDAVDYVLEGRRTIRVKSEGTVISEVTRNANATFVHLLNWDEGKPVSDVHVSLLTSGPIKSVN